ncbi:hypothetical protein CKAH01_04027 [Colletotrichum kahawae]|uniref:Uncharacterized protein n=1 Tax=Colletotrichum kahawae TaxID=34407 RepID=A0AAE0DDB2_COLKA|nr:hypothetical protein CKAH01_04027 [Colletotrichum kahawae]
MRWDNWGAEKDDPENRTLGWREMTSRVGSGQPTVAGPLRRSASASSSSKRGRVLRHSDQRPLEDAGNACAERRAGWTGTGTGDA